MISKQKEQSVSQDDTLCFYNALVEKKLVSTTMSSQGRQPVAISWNGVGTRTQYLEIATSPFGSSQ